MKTYSQLKSTNDFLEFMKELYFPSAKKIEQTTMPKMNFLTVSGIGSPESDAFQNAVPALYGIAYTIKMGMKFNKLARPAGYFDFKMPPLEGLWWQGDNTSFDVNDRDNWEWQLMIMMPAFVTNDIVGQAKTQAQAKHPDIPYSGVRLQEFDEGSSIQTTHIGPYSTEPQTIKKLHAFIHDHDLKFNGKHHEVYMGDPRRTKPEKLKTVLRYPVK